MSDAQAPDPYATAKANLRDTIKWLATSLAAVGAAVLAGASLNGLAGLEGKALCVAAILGAVGLILILIAIAVLMSLLTSEIFYFSQLKDEKNAVTVEINKHVKDIVSPQISSVNDLITKRDTAANNANRMKPADPGYEAAYKEWISLKSGDRQRNQPRAISLPPK